MHLFTIIASLLAGEHFLPLASAPRCSELWLLNPEEEPCSLTLLLIRPDHPTEEWSATLAPWERRKVVDESCSGGWAVLSSSGSPVFHSLVRGTNQMALLLAQTQAADQLLVPHIAADPAWLNETRILLVAGNAPIELHAQAQSQPFPVGTLPFPGSEISTHWLGITPGDFPFWCHLIPSPSAKLAGFHFFSQQGEGQEERKLAGVSLPGQVESSLILPHVASDRTRWWTGLALVNPQAEEQILVLQAHGDEGLLDQLDLTLPSWSKKTVLVETLWNEQGRMLPPETTWLRLKADAGIVALFLFGTHDQRLLAALEGVTSGGPHLIFPVADQEDGSWAGIALLNLAERHAEITWRFHDQDLLLQTTQVLAPGAKRVALVEQLLPEAAGRSGWVEARSDVELTGFVLAGTGADQLGGMPAFHQQASSLAAPYPQPATYQALPGSDSTPDQLPLLSERPQVAQDMSHFLQNSIARAKAWGARYEQLNTDHRLTFGGILFLAHENNIRYFSREACVGSIKAMQAMGIGLVGLHAGPFPWLSGGDDSAAVEARAKYDALFQEASRLGLALRVMLPISNSSELPMSSFAEYSAAMKQLVELLLRRYNLAGKGRVAQIGMHEPSSIGLLVEGRPLDPTLWGHFVDDICDLVHSLDSSVQCTASLIPGPPARPAGPGEWAFQAAAMRSRADLLGVNNIHEYGLHEEVLEATNTFLDHFRFGMKELESGTWIPGRGDALFLNASWRPTWPITASLPLESNAAGTGCLEYVELDKAYLSALAHFARAKGLQSYSMFYTTSFTWQKNCTHTPELYSWVRSPFNGNTWPNYQEGNAITDHLYRKELEGKLATNPYQLTALGNHARDLISQWGLSLPPPP